MVLAKDDSGERVAPKPDEKEYYMHYVDCKCLLQALRPRVN